MKNYRELAKSLVTEDSEDDYRRRQEAIDVYKKMIEYLKSGGEIDTTGTAWGPLNLIGKISLDQFIDRDFRTYEPLEIRFREKKEKLRADYTGGVSNPDITINAVNVKSVYEEYGLNPEELDDLDADELREIVSSDRFKEILINDILDTLEEDRRYLSSFSHEYTHYLDDQRVQGDWYYLQRTSIESQDPSDEKLEKYFSDPIEINAFFQGILSRVQEKLESDPDYLKKMVEDEWEHDFSNFKEWFFSNRMGNVYDWIERSSDDKIKRRLINRLYGYWEKLLELYREESGGE